MRSWYLRDIPNLVILGVIIVGFYIPFGTNTANYYRDLSGVHNSWWPWEDGDDTSKPGKSYTYTFYSNGYTEEFVLRDSNGELITRDVESHTYIAVSFFVVTTLISISLAVLLSIFQKSIRMFTIIGRLSFFIYAYAIHWHVKGFYDKGFLDLRGLFYHEELISSPTWLDTALIYSVILTFVSSLVQIAIWTLESLELSASKSLKVLKYH